MKWNNDKKEEHGKWGQESSPSRIKNAWRNAMASVHNKFSRGAEYIMRMIPFARKDNWRGSRGHSPESKHSGHRSSDKK